jgi:hypothetical protein
MNTDHHEIIEHFKKSNMVSDKFKTIWSIRDYISNGSFGFVYDGKI